MDGFSQDKITREVREPSIILLIFLAADGDTFIVFQLAKGLIQRQCQLDQTLAIFKDQA